MDLQMIDVDVSTYIPNGEWDLVGKQGRTEVNLDIIRCLTGEVNLFGLVWFKFKKLPFQKK